MKFKNILLVIIFILFLSVYMAVKTKLSYINDVDINKYINEINTKLYVSSYEEDITEVFTLNESVIEVSDLENISPIIVKAETESQLLFYFPNRRPKKPFLEASSCLVWISSTWALASSTSTLASSSSSLSSSLSFIAVKVNCCC